jgi:ABC-2 type transport system ATP-binding protein
MEDVVQLCPRVVVIDQGQLIHDGDLRELTLRLKPDKRISLRFSGAAPAAADLARFGAVVSADGVQAVVQVKAEEVAAVVGALLAALPVTDLTVEDPPLEEVMKELFARGRAEAG